MTTYNYLYNVGYSLIFLFGAFIGIFGAIKSGFKSSLGRVLFYLGLGELCYGVGLIIWAYYNLILKVEIPYPSLADLFFIAFTPITAAGCIYLLKIVSYSSFKKKYIYEGIIVFLINAIIIVGFISKPDLSTELPLASKIANTLYPLWDSLLLTIAYLTYRIAVGKIHRGALILIVGIFLQVAADVVFSYRITHNLYWNGDWADVLYTLSATSITLAVIDLYENFTVPVRA